MKIELKSVRKTYPRTGQPALDIDCLRLNGGQCHGIVGHSGSGKSTLLNLLALLDRPDQGGGEIAFSPSDTEGERHTWSSSRASGSIRDGDAWRKRYYSFVFQAGYLLRNLPVMENVLLPLRIQGQVQKEDLAFAEETLTQLKLGREKWSALGWQMSGGEYQRAAVARALVRRPQVIFADEPTGSLDGTSAGEVMKLLHAWRTKEPGNLLILVTHNPQHALTYCDHITVLRNGRTEKDEPKEWYSLESLTHLMGGGG